MATQDRSPSLIIGQQWSALADLVSASTENDDEDGGKSENKSSSVSMKLGKQDMGLFGFCPSRDEFSLVVCEKCNLLVKPQALKQHIESRHGPTDLRSLGNIPASALNSELGKKLLMPLPNKCLNTPQTTTPNIRQVSGTFKPVSSGWPPTKASLKQVPASVKNISAPILGVSMKISPLKSVRSRNRIIPTTTTATAAVATTMAVTATTAATTTSATTSTSSLVVKVEKLEKVLTLPSKPETREGESAIPTTREGDSAIPTTNISPFNSLNLDSTKISTLMNGSVKSIISFTAPSFTASSFTPSFTAPSLTAPSLTPATTAHSLVTTPVLVAVTKSLTDNPINTKCVTTLGSTMSLTKPLIIAPVIAVGSAGTMAQRPLSSAKNTKIAKDQKERKFLPCKDREYDANKHCGVVFSETGKQCTRSLTCKTHSLSLRRAVPGRSKTFDELLKEHKAAKEALLKAKADVQNANAGAAPNRVLVSSATINPALLGFRPQATPVMFQQDCKNLHAPSMFVASKTAVPSNTVPPTTNFAKPISIFQRFSSSAILPPAITVTEESGHRVPECSTKFPSSSSPFPQDSNSEPQETKIHQNFLSHHPKPMANTQFTGRYNDKGCILFSRKMDYIRAALLGAIERQLNPPPYKKLCVESNLPQESQVIATSQDPYEFNMVDCNGVATYTLNTSLVNTSKPTIIKTKSKLPTSPVAATSSVHPLSSLSRCPGAPISLPVSSFSTLCTTPVTVSPALSPGLALNWPVKSQENVSTLNSSAFLSPVLATTSVTNPGKRKRNGSTGGSNSQLVSLTGSNGALTAGSAISVSPANITAGSVQQTGLTGILTPASLNSSQSGNMITIPNASLTNTNIGQLSAAKIASTPRVASPATAHRNNIFKDFNLVLTGIDPSLVNGQYVNITGAQLAELAASQGQTLFLNSFISGGTSCSVTPNSNARLNLASSLPTSKPAKRSRSSALKLQQTSANSNKITTNSLEGLKIIPSNSVITSGSLPPSAVLLDNGSLQGAMLSSVALATGTTTPTLVAINSSTDNSSSGPVPRNPTQLLCTDSPSIVSSTALVNGGTNSSYEKPVTGSQQHHHKPSSSKSHHHHHHQNSTNQQQNIALASVIHPSPSLAVPIPSGSATAAQLCSSQAIFKPGGTFNLATKTVGGKLTMQPVSLTFPISVSQAGLAALTSGRPQQQQQQPQHTLLVTTSGVSAGDMDSAAV